MDKPAVVTAEQWQQARDGLLAEEKQATRALDAIAAQRRRLPMVKFRTDYTFASSFGPRTLLDFFGSKPQLAVYQFMDNGPEEFCPGCTHFTRNVAALDVLADDDVSWVTVSNMPLEQMQAYWDRMGWSVPFASSRGTTFADDCGASRGFMLTLFLRDGDDVYRTYNTTQRGVDRLLFANNILDLAPYGRQQEWEDSPAGWPQHPTYG
jgi:predicted dithiol-disulfide oxidoreductase (DUF899 family)